MDSVDILGRNLPVEFVTSPDATIVMDEDRLRAGISEMAAKINGVHWSRIHSEAFRSMRKLVLFEGSVRVNGHMMSRSCCDEDDAIFFWESSEFDQNTDADVRANTFFHDCWHVIQFQRDGFARDEAERLHREVDAIDEQILVAQALGCSDHEVGHLRRFRDSHRDILARLKEGVEQLHRGTGSRTAHG